MSTNVKVKRILEHPIKKTELSIKFDNRIMDMTLKKYAKLTKNKIMNLLDEDPDYIRQLHEELVTDANGESSIILEIDDEKKEIVISSEMMKITEEEKVIYHEEFIPHVIEPSFGIDRIVYYVLNSAFWIRKEDNNRTVLSLNKKVCPYKIMIVPLQMDDNLLKYIPKIVEHAT